METQIQKKSLRAIQILLDFSDSMKDIEMGDYLIYPVLEAVEVIILIKDSN